MKENLKVLLFSPKEDRFGIKVVNADGDSFWINGFGKCPVEYVIGSSYDISYHTVEKGGINYHNYGEPKKAAIGQELDKVWDELEKLANRITEIEEAMSEHLQDHK